MKKKKGRIGWLAWIKPDRQIFPYHFENPA
jgi:hypothetical protein